MKHIIAISMSRIPSRAKHSTRSSPNPESATNISQLIRSMDINEILSNVDFNPFAAAPQPTGHQMPVNIGKSPSLEPEEDSSGLLLVVKERLVHDSSILEFCQ